MPVIIGSKYTGKPAGFVDTSTGVYWETLPRIEGDALKIQRALLTKPAEPRHGLRARLSGRQN